MHTLKRRVARASAVFMGLALCSTEVALAGINGSDRQANGINGSDRQANGINGSDRQANGINGSDRQANGINGSDRQANGINGSDRQANGINGSDRQVSGINGSDRQVSGINGSDRQVSGINGSDRQVSGINGSDRQVRGINGSDRQANGINGSDRQVSGINGSDRQVRGINGSDRQVRGISSASAVALASGSSSLFESIAVGPVEARIVGPDGSAGVVVLGANFSVDSDLAASLSEGTYVLAASTDPAGASTIVIPVSEPYIAGASPVVLRGFISAAHTNIGQLTIGTTAVDYSSVLSMDASFAPALGQILEVVGTQPHAGSAILPVTK